MEHSHLDPETCPGAKYFRKKETVDREEMRSLFQEVVGDVPKYMKMAGRNRIWLFALTGLWILLEMVLIII